MNNISYGVAYQYMMVAPWIEQKVEDEVWAEGAGLVLPVEKVCGNSVGLVRRDNKGKSVDLFV